MVALSTLRVGEARPNTILLAPALTALLSSRYRTHVMLPSVHYPLIIYN